MYAGTISNNTVDVLSNASGTGGGGGVYVDAGGDFKMNGGTISGNTARTNNVTKYGSGGGVFVMNDSRFIMSADGTGTISGNEAGYKGGGVYVYGTGSTRGAFGKPATGGTIYGKDAEEGLKNKAYSDKKGHAVYMDYNGEYYRDLTVGPDIGLDSGTYWLEWTQD